MSFADTQSPTLPPADGDAAHDAGVTLPGSLDALWDHLHAAPARRSCSAG